MARLQSDLRIDVHGLTDTRVFAQLRFGLILYADKSDVIRRCEIRFRTNWLGIGIGTTMGLGAVGSGRRQRF